MLSSPSAIRAVLDKTGLLTSGRPRSIMQTTTDGLHMAIENASELNSVAFLYRRWNLSFFLGTGVWRRARKAFQLFLTAEAVDKHLPTQEAESIQLLNDLLATPQVCCNDLNLCSYFDASLWQEIYTHIMRNTASLAASLVYGKCFPVYEGSEAEVYFKGIKLVNEINDQTKYPPLEFMPWIKYIPRWLAPVGLFIHTLSE